MKHLSMRFVLCSLALFALASQAVADPTFDLVIHADSKLTPLTISGTIADPAQTSVKFAETTALAGYTLTGPEGPIDLKRKTTSGLPVKFSGTFSQRSGDKFRTGDDEVYCLNRVFPNPEVEADGAYYKVKFDLPAGYRGLASDPGVRQEHGLAFQIARLQEPKKTRVDSMDVEYNWPQDFNPDARYVAWFEQCLAQDLKLLGPLAISKLRVGAIRRGGRKEVNGSPSGNLILYSRSALGGEFDPSAPAGLELQSDLSDGLKKLAIARELAHFWYGQAWHGTQGWMTEGVAQYVALVNLRQDPGVNQEDVRKFLEAGGKSVRGPIPAAGLEGDDYIRAYYQAPRALWELGEIVGHEKFLRELNYVFAGHPNPEFEDFESYHLTVHPRHKALWKSVWKLEEKA